MAIRLARHPPDYSGIVLFLQDQELSCIVLHVIGTCCIGVLENKYLPRKVPT